MRLFFHCHKAGGTTIVQAAKESGMKLPEQHRNGNPFGANGKRIEWSDLNVEQTLEVLDGLHREGVDLVACEFSFPQWSALKQLPYLQCFTSLRDPAARAFSNYRMDVLNEKLPIKQTFGFSSYYSQNNLFQSNNYYVRVFTNVMRPRVAMTRDHLRVAKERLDAFAAVVMLEKGDLAHQLAPLGFRPDVFQRRNVVANRPEFKKYDPEQSGLDIETFPDDPQFFADNAYDYALYSYCMHKAEDKG